MIDATTDHLTCRRCRIVLHAHEDSCYRCGLTFGPTADIEAATKVRLIDAMAASDLDRLVVLVLDAHADGLIEVRP